MDFEESIAVAVRVMEKLRKDDLGAELLGDELWTQFCEAFQDA